MLVSAMATEICSRIGEGFSQHSARAKVLFWKALGILVNDGKVKIEDIRSLYNSSVYLAPLWTTPSTILSSVTLSTVTSTTPASPTWASIISDYYVFDQKFMMFDGATAPTADNKVFCSEVSENQFESVEHLLELAIMQHEVIYTIKYPTLKLKANWTPTGTTPLNIENRYYGIAKATADADATELNTYLTTAIQNMVIDAAAELLKVEIV
jgi:hypothetical protein